MNKILLKDYIDRSKGTNCYSNVRYHARQITSLRQQKCEICSYDKHVETCHIKSICEFEDDELIATVNAEDNLILLCPNCHWEHDNYLKKIKAKERRTCKCGETKYTYSDKCRKCENTVRKTNLQTRKVERPPKEELQMLINTIPMTQIGKKYGVSDNAIRKWCRTYKIKINKFGGPSPQSSGEPTVYETVAL